MGFEQDSVPGQLDAIRERLDHGDRRMKAIEHAVAENTRITRDGARQTNENAEVLEDIRSAQVAGRILTKGIKWLSAATIAVSAVWALIYQATHGGKLP
jgi:hypothetical protein